MSLGAAWRVAVLAAMLVMPGEAIAYPETSKARIRREYKLVWGALVRQGWGKDSHVRSGPDRMGIRPETHRLFEDAWRLVGAWVALHAASRPTPAVLAARMAALGPAHGRTRPFPEVADGEGIEAEVRLEMDQID